MPGSSPRHAAFRPDSFLGALPLDDATALLRCGRERTYKRGEAIFVERQAPDSVAVLLSGRVKVTALSREREAVIAFRGPGDLLGELSALDRQPRGATVTALERVEAQVIAASEFRTFLDGRPAAGRLALETISRRLREGSKREAELGGGDTTSRVCARLVELCDNHGEPDGDGTRITLPITQEELAAWAGGSRESVQRALYALRDAGWLRIERRGIVVLDRDALERSAG